MDRRADADGVLGKGGEMATAEQRMTGADGGGRQARHLDCLEALELAVYT